MITTAILFVFLSFYIFYNTSKRAVKYSGFNFETWLFENALISKSIATVLLITSLVLHVIAFGLGSGILLFFIILMTLASLIVLLTPLQLINYKSLLLLFIVAFSFEFFMY